MDSKQIKQKRDEVVEKYGEWTAHNIHLGDGVYTYDDSRPDFNDSFIGYTKLLRRVLQVAYDLTNQPLSSLRVLDLGCLEGIYAIEFAMHGAEVVGIEIREANIRKAEFAKDVLSLSNVSFVQDDVRNISAEKYGQFDVVLCIGILYHLDAPDVFHFVERMTEVCGRVLIIDTHVGLNPNRSHEYQGHAYYGWTYTEHTPESTEAEKAGKLWASIDNPASFWFSRSSLFNLLADAGFTSVYDCYNPAFPGRLDNRDTIAAVKGEQLQQVLTFSTKGESIPLARWSEKMKVAAESGQNDSGITDGVIRRTLKRAYRKTRQLVGRRPAGAQ